MLVLQEQKPVNMSNYTQNTRFAHGLGPAHGAGSSPQMIEKMTSKWLSLATTSILGQPPRLCVRSQPARDGYAASSRNVCDNRR